MRRLLLTLVAVCALGASTTAATAFADGSTAGQLQYAVGSTAVPQNAGWDAADTAAAAQTASQEKVVILQSWETDELEALKAANPNITVLMYADSSAASTSASSSGQYSTGVSYQQASANNWLLDNTSGQPFAFEGYNWLYATDIGSTSYQNTWASNVISELNSAPWSGVFMDDVNPTIMYHYPVSEVAKYPSDATYSAAMGSFVENVGPQIKADGKLAIANIGSWSSYGSTVDPWLQSLSGGMDEEFLKWGTSAGTGYADEGTWQTQLAEIQLCESEGKLFLGVSHSSSTDEAAAVYGYATELLAGDGNTSFSLAQDYSNATSFPEYGYQLGQPTGNDSVTPGGVYERAFTSGLALVNPTSAPVTVNLGGSYSGSGLSSVTTVTMAPQTGLVLTANPGTSTSGASSASGATPPSSGTAPTSGAGSTPTSGAGSTPTSSAGSSSEPPSGSTSAPSGAAGSTSSASGHDSHWYYERWVARHHAEAHARSARLHAHSSRRQASSRRHAATLAE